MGYWATAKGDWDEPDILIDGKNYYCCAEMEVSGGCQYEEKTYWSDTEFAFDFDTTDVETHFIGVMDENDDDVFDEEILKKAEEIMKDIFCEKVKGGDFDTNIDYD